ncbi:MAG: hypothetical protein ABJF23_11185 [Bryobacteraceae bacterium]
MSEEKKTYQVKRGKQVDIVEATSVGKEDDSYVFKNGDEEVFRCPSKGTSYKVVDPDEEPIDIMMG